MWAGGGGWVDVGWGRGGEGGRGVGVRRGDVSSSRTEGIGSRRKILVKRKCAVQKKNGWDARREGRFSFFFSFFFLPVSLIQPRVDK